MKTKQAIQKCGSVRKLATMLNISTAAVYAWGEEVPTLRAYQLEEKLNRAIPTAPKAKK